MVDEKNRRGETDEENNEKLQVKWEEWGGGGGGGDHQGEGKD